MAGKGEGKTKEAVYRRQLEELGVWQDAFAPEVKTLAQLERELTRAQKAWRATEPDPKKAPDMTDPLYGVITGLRREILVHRDALGLTPKALRKLRGPAPAGPSEQDLICAKLSQIAERVSAYDEGMNAGDAEKRSFDSLTLAQDDKDGQGARATARVAPTNADNGGTPRAASPTESADE